MRKGLRNDTLHERTPGDRYEIKYLVSESQAAAIARFISPYMRLDRYCKPHQNNFYPVVSLYLDSENLQLCRESLEGRKNRFKLRVRRYNEDPNYPCFFEIKRRANTVIIKDRTPVQPMSVSPLILGTQTTNGNGNYDGVLDQFLLYLNSLYARPVIRTRYLRQAFEGLIDDRLRVTFDRDVSYCVKKDINVSFDGQGWQSLFPNRVILEIKFTGRYPPWLGRMVKHFNLKARSTSKYALSVKKSCLLGFCAPRIRG